MTAGTKIFLALFALIVATLVVYYGVVMPDAAPMVHAPAGSPLAEAEDTEQIHRERESEALALENSQPPAQGPGVLHANLERRSPPPREPAPLGPSLVTGDIPRASSAGGLLSEGLREADGESGGGVSALSQVLGRTAGEAESADAQGGLIPLIGLNAGNFQSTERSANVHDVIPVAAETTQRPSDAVDSDPRALTVDSISTDKMTKAGAAEPMTDSVSPSSTPSRMEYVIEEGDTFSSIAEEWLGSSSKWSFIAKANPTVDPQKLKIGQRIFLPPKSVAASVALVESVVGEGESIYQVQSGDTLIRIARSYFGIDSRWEDIYALNKPTIGNDPATLKVGMRLRLPPK